ncbi:MAG: NAD(P)/FAD-dependent oxidoreductase [Nitrospira sp.]|nr:NAD(P)/FAD-dependent oxidoreductase [Nitrospira sp.]
MDPKRTRVVILGGGFGGLAAAQVLRDADLDITLIDRTNHHLFQPLLYQVATAALSPGDIAWPLRTIFRSRRNVRVVMGEVQAIDRAARQVQVMGQPPCAYDALIVAVGSRHAYFSRPDWEGYAPGLKTLADAVALRARMLMAFEQEERRAATAADTKSLTFVIVGGGPTGVELAGAMAEIGRNAMLPDFPSLQRDAVRILLVEAGPRLLPGFPPDLSAHAQTALESMGVTVLLSQPVRDVGPTGVALDGQFIETRNIIWAAGNRAAPLLSSLKAPLDKAGRVLVRPDLTVPDDDWVFVIGDAAAVQDGQGHFLPGLAPVAMQEGRYVATVIEDRMPSTKRAAFRYVDRGILATIGRAKAVAQFGPIHVSGFWAWLLWCTVHIFFLIGFRNRFRVVSEWIWYYLTFKPGARLIDQSQDPPHS